VMSTMLFVLLLLFYISTATEQQMTCTTSCSTAYYDCILEDTKTETTCDCVNTYKNCIAGSSCTEYDRIYFDSTVCYLPSTVNCSVASCEGCSSCTSNYTTCLLQILNFEESPLNVECTCLDSYSTCLSSTTCYLEDTFVSACGSLGFWCSTSDTTFSCNGQTFTYHAPSPSDVQQLIAEYKSEFVAHWQAAIDGVSSLTITDGTQQGANEVFQVTVSYDTAEVNITVIITSFKTLFSEDLKIDLSRITITTSNKRDVLDGSGNLNVVVAPSSGNGASIASVNWGLMLVVTFVVVIVSNLL